MPLFLANYTDTNCYDLNRFRCKRLLRWVLTSQNSKSGDFRCEFSMQCRGILTPLRNFDRQASIPNYNAGSIIIATSSVSRIVYERGWMCALHLIPYRVTDKIDSR